MYDSLTLDSNGPRGQTPDPRKCI